MQVAKNEATAASGLICHSSVSSQKQTQIGINSVGRDDSCRERCMWYISHWTLQKPHNLWGAYIMLFRAVCSCMWARAELTEQLWGRLQVKDESSPQGRHQSLMDWHIWEERQREAEGDPGGNRQWTHSYAAEFWPCWEAESLLTSSSKPIPVHINPVSPVGGKKKDMRQYVAWLQ